MRVLLADGHHKVRSALRLLLEQEPGVSVVGEVAEADDLLYKVQATRPDLVLLDWELPGPRGNGAAQGTQDCLNNMRSLYPDVRVVALSGRPEARWAAMAAGADGFVSKGDPPEHLLTTLHGVGLGGVR